MKYTFILILGIVTHLSVSAQTYEIRRDTTTIVNDDKYKVETNRFFQNWFIGAGAGAQIFYADHNRNMELGDRFTPAFEAYVGKWFTPGIGVSLGVNGFKLNGLTQNGSYAVGPYDKLPWEGYWLERKEVNFIHLRGDVLFNLNNLLGGYRSDRFYEISPYAGLGLMMVTKYRSENPGSGRDVSASIGVLNTFRLSEAFQLTLNVRGSMVADRFSGETGGRMDDGVASATVGIKYNFGKKRGWDQSKTTIIKYNEEDLSALRSAVNRLAQDNDHLRKQLAEAKSPTITEVQIERNTLVAPILVTFEINKSIVSNDARVNLSFFADMIKEGDPNIRYSITGYADKGTGTTKINERLSRERAEAIYNVLVREFNVSPTQLIKEYKGGVDNMYYDDPRLSRAVIVIAD
ncbi:OmpA family protein [Sphingobacterium sp. lm-10]|uniref:OmpA family protein n=1 Tax=Sphingobacterium sp. lm-10 TaxID=2944904 RepID=UPI0020208429|nr:OmpA family protein [Sphingobacterium sp. lm-10]MCL7988592.1 OmpA family protein [Sphingobacterium sp. lm-10]